jgi:hypothetical protein
MNKLIPVEEVLRAFFPARGKSAAAVKPAQPLATCVAELCTPRQLRLLRRLARQGGTSAGMAAYREFGCRPEELSRRSAAWLIGVLRAQEAGKWAGCETELVAAEVRAERERLAASRARREQG